jgi:hypothetical protein
LSDRLQDTSARARVTDGLGEIEDRSTQRENIIAARDQRDCDDVIEDSNEDDQTDTYVKRLKYEFQQTFDAMSNQQKWKLTTDKVVEDAMYTFGMKCTEEHLVHSFVLDTADPTYLDHNVFTEQELQEIKTCDKKPLVRLPDDLREYINSFSENDCGKLRQKVDTSWPWQADYDLSKNGDYDWVRNTVYGLVREYEADNFSHDHLEGWYSVHVWRLFDTVFDILENVDVSR